MPLILCGVTLRCLVEIPKGSRNKYVYDEALGGIKLDRFLFASVVYPADSGFLLDTEGPLRAFVLPAGTAKAAALHLARTTCRRAERAVVHLARTEAVPELFLVYLNRLSDLLFTLARLANHREGAGDVAW